MPMSVDPVRSTSQPISHGPRNPARLPMELMSAMPAAAAAPARMAVGRHQNCASEVVTPAIAKDIPHNAMAGSRPKRTVTSQPAAPTNPGASLSARAPPPGSSTPPGGGEAHPASPGAKGGGPYGKEHPRPARGPAHPPPPPQAPAGGRTTPPPSPGDSGKERPDGRAPPVR